MAIVFHADDYGITTEQARSILALCDTRDGNGVLTSISAFANSPAFEESATLAAPYIERKSLKIGVHLNLVEGFPCSEATNVPLLVRERGTFCNDFTTLLMLSKGSQRVALRSQIERECRAQIERFLTAFPAQRGTLRIDSHQHTHAIPLVFDALLAAVRACGCTLEHVRTPVEPLSPHLATTTAVRRLSVVNLAKDMLISTLWRSNRGKLPANCNTSLFCGVLLSGRMELIDSNLIHEFETLAAKRGETCEIADDGNKDACPAEKNSPTDAERTSPAVEVLFHPVSVPREQCLDPTNEPFARACTSSSRDAEAQALVRLRETYKRPYVEGSM